MVLLGDSVHATLPYLASGAGMSFEDGAVLGHCLAGILKTSPGHKHAALTVYEACRVARTKAIVARGLIQQELNHLVDGPERVARDEKMRVFAKVEEGYRRGSATDWISLSSLSPSQSVKPGDDPLVWRRFGAGEWLLSYSAKGDVEKRWQARLKAERI